MSRLSFSEAFADITRQYPRVQTRNLATTGMTRVIDQSPVDVAGFSSVVSGIDRGPVIVFGDHTRVVKYADGPFILGADGTKILKPSSKLVPRFAYHLLASQKIATLGYSRHFKLLKELAFEIPALDEQRRIADILDRVDVARGGANSAQNTLTQAMESFTERLAAKASTSVRFGELISTLSNGLSPSTAGEFTAEVHTLSAITRGSYDPAATKAGMFARNVVENDFVRPGDFLICRGNGNQGLVGAGVYVSHAPDHTVFPDTVFRARTKPSKVDPLYLEAIWASETVREQVIRLARTTNGTYKVNQKNLRSIQVPMIGLAEQHKARVALQKFAALQVQLLERSAQLDSLQLALAARAFKGKP